MTATDTARHDQLMGRQRPHWADDPTLVLPCQTPDVNPDWWFEGGLGMEARLTAIRLCRRCPKREPCRDQARANREPWGVWGGEVFEKPPQRRGPKPKESAS